MKEKWGPKPEPVEYYYTWGEDVPKQNLVLPHKSIRVYVVHTGFKRYYPTADGSGDAATCRSLHHYSAPPPALLKPPRKRHCKKKKARAQKSNAAGEDKKSDVP